MINKEVRENIKTGAYIVTEIGAGILLGAVGGTLIRKIGGNILVKGLCLIGWSGIAGKISKDAADSVSEDLDGIFDTLDEYEARANGKEYKSA